MIFGKNRKRRARVAHAALEHCRVDGGCGRCSLCKECDGDINVLLGMAADVLAELLHGRLIEDSKKPGGLKVTCHKDADGCKDLGPTGKCARFGCMCEAVHCEEEREDE